MSLEIWIAFVVASAALLAIPGPTVTVVVGHAIARGPRAVWATAPGVVLGDFTAMTLSLLGVGAVLATSASLFAAMKLVGALYLVWLGIKMWRECGAFHSGPQATRKPLRAVFWNCYVVTALNPKDILFFVAFVPQFINPALPYWPQVLILELTFLTMVAGNIALWTLSTGHLRARFARPGRMRLFNRIGGTLLIGAAAATTAS